jgi:hypothetical protein
MTDVSMQTYHQAVAAGMVFDGEIDGTEGLQPTERLFIERTLLHLYPRLKNYDLIPWKWINGPLIPDFIVRHTGKNLRRIVEINCGDGLFSNILSLLYPDIEIIGIDPDREKIAAARATIGYRQNLKFIHANAAILAEIPCDRIIYNHCLSKLNSVFAFKKLMMKTSRWLVDEGDFIIKESPFSLVQNLSLMKELFPLLRETRSLAACLRTILAELGYPNPMISQSPGLLGWPSELFCRGARGLMLNGSPVAAGRQRVTEWEDWGEQSDDSLLGFLFANGQTDFSKELL